jgi:GntR family transcriptional regulator
LPFEMQLDYDRGLPVYRQIYEAVVQALSTGRLAKDEQLPTIHDLAARLDINPNTVARAYRDLERDGHIVAKRGRGTFPAAQLRPSEGDREAILHDIYTRALADGARHAIGAREIIRYFRKALHEDSSQ